MVVTLYKAILPVQGYLLQKTLLLEKLASCKVIIYPVVVLLKIGGI